MASAGNPLLLALTVHFSVSGTSFASHLSFSAAESLITSSKITNLKIIVDNAPRGGSPFYLGDDIDIVLPDKRLAKAVDEKTLVRILHALVVAPQQESESMVHRR